MGRQKQNQIHQPNTLDPFVNAPLSVYRGLGGSNLDHNNMILGGKASRSERVGPPLRVVGGVGEMEMEMEMETLF